MKDILNKSKIISEHNVDLKKSQVYCLKNKVLKSYDDNYEDLFHWITLFVKRLAGENTDSAIVTPG
jgi:hypothetical protein